MRLRVLSLLSKGGTSVPVGSAADENRHHEEAITKKQNEKITVAMALGAARLSLRIATTASRCRGGHVRDPKHVPG